MNLSRIILIVNFIYLFLLIPYSQILPEETLFVLPSEALVTSCYSMSCNTPISMSATDSFSSKEIYSILDTTEKTPFPKSNLDYDNWFIRYGMKKYQGILIPPKNWDFEISAFSHMWFRDVVIATFEHKNEKFGFVTHINHGSAGDKYASSYLYEEVAPSKWELVNEEHGNMTDLGDFIQELPIHFIYPFIFPVFQLLVIPILLLINFLKKSSVIKREVIIALLIYSMSLGIGTYLGYFETVRTPLFYWWNPLPAILMYCLFGAGILFVKRGFNQQKLAPR